MSSMSEQLTLSFKTYFTSRLKQLQSQWRAGLAFVFVGITAYVIGTIMPLGYDWENFFSPGILPPYFMPWTLPLVAFFNWPGLFTVSILALFWRARRYQASPWLFGLMVTAWPTLWCLYFLGNIDGLALLGLMLGPVGVPLILLKPQVAAFALLAHRRWLIALALWLMVSVLIWGWWPERLLLVTNDPNWKLDWPQDITLFPWGLLIALPLMWFSRGDEDLMMAAGSLCTPHIFPYHFIMLLPALARMPARWALVTWGLLWCTLLANWLGPIGWHFGNIASVTFWFGIYRHKSHPAPPGG